MTKADLKSLETFTNIEFKVDEISFMDFFLLFWKIEIIVSTKVLWNNCNSLLVWSDLNKSMREWVRSVNSFNLMTLFKYIVDEGN